MSTKTRSTTFRLSAEQRAELRHVAPVVTDALIDELLPLLDHLAYRRSIGSGRVDTGRQQRAAAEYEKQAEAVAAFRAVLLSHTAKYTRARLLHLWAERDIRGEVAERLLLGLPADLDDVEALLLKFADAARPHRGVQRDMHITTLVLNAARLWAAHTGKKAGISEGGPFVRFCQALGDQLGLDLTLQKIRTALKTR